MSQLGTSTHDLLSPSPNHNSQTTKSHRKPCDRCKAQHLKCVYDSEQCRRCERSGHECIRSRRSLRFRRVPASKFQSHQPNRDLSQNAPTTASQVSAESPFDSFDVRSEDSTNHTFQTMNGNATTTVFADRNGIPPGSDRHTTSEIAHMIPAERRGPVTAIPQVQDTSPPQSAAIPSFKSPSSIRPRQAIRSDDTASLALSQALTPFTQLLDSDRASISSSSGSHHRWMVNTPRSDYLNGIVKPMLAPTTRPRLYLEIVLLRYFHDELAPWFDLCDPDCHFATVVLQRAREQGPLRNALLTISARNLARNKRFRNSAGSVQWNDNLLSQLTEESAVPYHNECIRDLLQLSMDPKNLQDENLLAAVIALRTDEEMDHNVQGEGEDQQLFLRIASVFIEAQVPPMIALPHSSPPVFPSANIDGSSQVGGILHASPAAHSTEPSPSNHTEPDLGGSGLRQACFWTQFRQELHASFLKQQPVRFPLTRCDAFRQLTPATDAVWANRMVTLCADVLEFCYGSESSDGQVAPAYANRDRWIELRAHEQSLCSLLPASFEPTYCNEPDAALGEAFPEIWYLDPCHVSGTTYIELARMLLQIFNPTRPQLGPGFLAATNAFIVHTKKILYRLCGIALSNRHCAPSLINACIGISIFGEYFGEAEEQDALLRVLSFMTERHAYPTHQIALALKCAWGRNDIVLDAQYLPATERSMEPA